MNSMPCRITQGPQYDDNDCEDYIQLLSEDQIEAVLDELWPQSLSSGNAWRDMYRDEDGDLDLHAAMESALFNRPETVRELAKYVYKADMAARMTARANLEREVADNIKQSLIDIGMSPFGPGSFTKRQAD